MRWLLVFVLAFLFALSSAIAVIADVHADTFVVRSSLGIPVDVRTLPVPAEPCGPVTKAELEHFVRGPLIGTKDEPKFQNLVLTVTDTSFVYAGLDTTYDGSPADKVLVQDDSVFGIWHRGRRTIVMTLTKYKKPVGPLRLTHSLVISFLVEKDEKTRDKVSCMERWAGSVRP